LKKVGILFIIFLALAAFVYFYEILGEGEREEARSLEESLLRTRQEEITAVEILHPATPARGNPIEEGGG